MTLKEYVKSLAERIYRIETEGGGGSQGGATKEYVDNKVATATGILQNEINTTNQVVDGNITDISTLQGQMSTAQGDIAQLEIDVDTNTEDIGNNTTAIGNNTQLINQVNGQVEINTADIGTLSGRVSSVETKATNTENLVGNKTDLPDTTKSVALNVAQLNNKITWQYLGDFSRNTSVSVANYSEFLVATIYDTTIRSQITLPTSIINGMSTIFYGDKDGGSGLTRLLVSNYSISMADVYINGTDYSSGSHIKVYAR